MSVPPTNARRAVFVTGAVKASMPMRFGVRFEARGGVIVEFPILTMSMPDPPSFNRSHPRNEASVTNFDRQLHCKAELVGLRFT
jgi:hypothetical protein